jgi:hypothetical protein
MGISLSPLRANRCEKPWRTIEVGFGRPALGDRYKCTTCQLYRSEYVGQEGWDNSSYFSMRGLSDGRLAVVGYFVTRRTERNDVR